jgi:acetyltransferase-like isoleucine patch superfamily enzyme
MALTNDPLKDGSQQAERVVKAVHGLRKREPDPDFVEGMARFLRSELQREQLAELYQQFGTGEGKFAQLMRRIVFKSLARQCGDGLVVSSQVGFKHIETFEIGSSVFIGAGSYLQGWFEGRFVIGDHVWIGPQSYFDARDLVLEDYVGWGPGARILGSTHTGVPVDVPIVQTDLRIRPVRIEAWADIGTNAVILPGVTVGRGSIVGAGAVVAKDVPPFAAVAGVPARFLYWREGRDKGTTEREDQHRK